MRWGQGEERAAEGWDVPPGGRPRWGKGCPVTSARPGQGTGCPPLRRRAAPVSAPRPSGVVGALQPPTPRCAGLSSEPTSRADAGVVEGPTAGSARPLPRAPRHFPAAWRARQTSRGRLGGVLERVPGGP